MNTPSDGRPLFLGVGQLGWATMGAVLEVSFQDAPVDVVNLPKSTPDRAVVSTLKRSDSIRALARWADLTFRARPQRLAAAIDQLSRTPTHVHCFGHLVAVPDVFRRKNLTFSVSTDESWTTATYELYKPRNAVERRRYINRIAAEKDIFESATFVSCISQWAANSVVNNFNVKREAVHVDPFPLPSLPPTTRRRSDARWLTFIGNDFTRKGGDRLLRWHQAELSHLAELHIISSAPPPRRHHELRNVVWHGSVAHREIRSEILPRTLVLALPTRIDQSPYVISEAAECGVASVASAIAGIPELIRDDETGFVVPPDSDSVFVDKLRLLLSDPVLAGAMGDRAHHHLNEVVRPALTPARLLQRVLEIG